LADLAVDALAPIRARYEDIRRSDALPGALKDGAERAGAVAARTMARVKACFGLGVGARA
jgi:tryptophanyl-tRNA synthetase